jgi:Fe-S cluster biogenesis protein NfuA
VADAKEFQERVQQIGKLIAELEQIPDSPAKAGTRELVCHLLEVHGAGIERMMEIVFDSDTPGPRTIEKLASDPMVRSLMLLYSLHPDDLQERVRKAVEVLRPRLRKLNCDIEVIEIAESAVRLQLASSAHACGSTRGSLRAMVEEAIYEYAPDITSLMILGLEGQPSIGFVRLESLAPTDIAHESALRSHPLATGGAD